MRDVLDKYLELIEEDNKYCYKYMMPHMFYDEEKGFIPMLVLLEQSCIWKTISTRIVLNAVINSNSSDQLLKIEDFYSDELYELFKEFHIIDETKLTEEEYDKIYSIEELKRRLNDNNTPKKLKDCIRLYIKCNKVCEEFNAYIKLLKRIEK